MFKFVSSVCAAAMTLSLPLAAPAAAMPMPERAWDQSRIIQVQGGAGDNSQRVEPGLRWDGRDSRWDRRVERRDRDRWDRRVDRRDRDRYSRLERRGDRYYYRGHRGYRDARPGYRQYQGWWFPPAAFIAGAIVGGAVSQPPVRAVPVDAHAEWCHARYRSYRAWDNTFQPYNGPRRQCISPYG